MTEREDQQAEPPAVPSGQGEEPEPDWAAEIHRHRRARGDRLRRIFSRLDEEEEER